MHWFSLALTILGCSRADMDCGHEADVGVWREADAAGCEVRQYSQTEPGTKNRALEWTSVFDPCGRAVWYWVAEGDWTYWVDYVDSQLVSITADGPPGFATWHYEHDERRRVTSRVETLHIGDEPPRRDVVEYSYEGRWPVRAESGVGDPRIETWLRQPDGDVLEYRLEFGGGSVFLEQWAYDSEDRVAWVEQSTGGEVYLTWEYHWEGDLLVRIDEVTTSTFSVDGETISFDSLLEYLYDYDEHGRRVSERIYDPGADMWQSTYSWDYQCRAVF